MLLVRIAIASARRFQWVQQHMFLWRIVENYPKIIIKYSPYLFLCMPFHNQRGLTLALSYAVSIIPVAVFANSVYPDEMAHNDPSHQDLQCLWCFFKCFNDPLFLMNGLSWKLRKLYVWAAMFTLSTPVTVIIVFANSVDPDQLARNEPSHQALQCLSVFFRFFVKTEPIFLRMDWSEN